MNRIVADALIAELITGKHVTVLSGNVVCQAKAFAVIESRLPADLRDVLFVYRSNGRQLIRLVDERRRLGGDLSFRVLKTGVRGLDLDLLFVDVPEDQVNDETKAEFMPGLLVSGGDVIYA